jgi:hypothetical protein
VVILLLEPLENSLRNLRDGMRVCRQTGAPMVRTRDVTPVKRQNLLHRGWLAPTAGERLLTELTDSDPSVRNFC